MNNQDPNTRVGRHSKATEPSKKSTPKSPFYGESRAARKADKADRKKKGSKKPHKN